MAIADLWLAILLAAVGVFIMSSLVHMLIGWHKGDYTKLPAEAELMALLREHGTVPGQYMFPCAGSYKEAQTPEMVAKFKQGPVGFLNVPPPAWMNMGRSLLIWFLYTLLIGVFVAYILTLALAPSAEYMDVFRLACTVSILAYAVPAIVDSIWKGIRWGITLRYIGDGILYALVTAGVFAWQWPKA